MQVKKKLIPVMAEPIGVYSLPPGVHKNYKAIISKLNHGVDEQLIRRGDNSPHLRHICNRKDQNIYQSFAELKPLEELINSMVANFINEIGLSCDEVFTTNAWLNLGDRGASLPMHIHRNSYISGTYYVNYSHNDHSPLKFVNSRLASYLTAPGFMLPTNTSKPTEFNCSEFKVDYKEGDIVLWPSHLIHGYRETNKTDNRITLSFNTMPSICTDGQIYAFKASPLGQV